MFGIAGLAVPGALCIYFAAHHALGDLCFYVLRYNVVPRAERWGGSALHYFYLPIAAPFVIAGAFWIYKRSPDQEIAARRVFFALLPALYYLLLYSYWPDITAQDNLPAAPLDSACGRGVDPAVDGISRLRVCYLSLCRLHSPSAWP